MTFRGMRAMDVPLAERDAWLEGMAHRCLQKAKRGRARGIGTAYDWQKCLHLQIRVAELLMDDGQTEPARRILAQARSAFPAEDPGTVFGAINLIRAVAAKAGDAQLQADFNQWIRRNEQTKAHLIHIDWPVVDIFAGQKTANITMGNRRSPLQVPIISDYRHGNYRPLAEGGGRLYFYTMSPQTIAYLPLDARGRPIGTAVRNRLGFEMGPYPKHPPARLGQVVLACVGALPRRQAVRGHAWLGPPGVRPQDGDLEGLWP
jgi:hypothetical protein